MPYSDGAGIGWVKEKIQQISPNRVLDIGAGSGTYSDIIKSLPNQSIIIDAVEIWEPYIEQFDLKNKYNSIFLEDARKFEDFNYDLVIFGDVLEHMSREDALELWDKASKQAKYAIISIPIIHYPQGEWEGNPYEIHVEEDWNTEKVLESFKSIIDHVQYEVIGVFLAKFA